MRKYLLANLTSHYISMNIKKLGQSFRKSDGSPDKGPFLLSIHAKCKILHRILSPPSWGLLQYFLGNICQSHYSLLVFYLIIYLRLQYGKSDSNASIIILCFQLFSNSQSIHWCIRACVLFSLNQYWYR